MNIIGNNNYKIILDKNELIKFIDWLPDLKENEKYFFCLLARKKYDNTMSYSQELMLQKFATHKDLIYDKIKRFESPKGTFTHRGKEINNKSLCVYMNPNPRDLTRASYKLISNLAQRLSQGDIVNPKNEAMKSIQKSAGTKHFAHFDYDIDLDSKLILDKLSAILPIECFDIFQTRGGYHILVNLRLIRDMQWTRNDIPKNWYKQISDICDRSGDQLLPVPGCTQGLFTPKMI